MELAHLLKFILGTFGEFWPWVLVLVAVLAAYIYGGERLAILVGVIGFAVGFYLKGRKDQAAKAKREAQEIREKREKAYEQIDARGTSAAYVSERLRKRSF